MPLPEDPSKKIVTHKNWRSKANKGPDLEKQDKDLDGDPPRRDRRKKRGSVEKQ